MIGASFQPELVIIGCGVLVINYSMQEEGGFRVQCYYLLLSGFWLSHEVWCMRVVIAKVAACTTEEHVSLSPPSYPITLGNDGSSPGPN